MSSSLPNLTFYDVHVKMPLMMLPVRTTVIQLKAARVLFSPASTLSEEQLGSMGEITDIVAPSLFHLDGARPATLAHPNARLWGPQGANEKHPDLRWFGIFGQETWPYEDEVAAVDLAGMPKVNEVLFVHRESSSLLATDLVFNIENPKGFGSWLILSIFGTHGRFGVSRLYMGLVKARPAFENSIEKLIRLDFQYLIPAHGAIVSTEAKAKLIAALRERGCLKS